jgi:hypothetical protein
MELLYGQQELELLKNPLKKGGKNAKRSWVVLLVLIEKPWTTKKTRTTKSSRRY